MNTKLTKLATIGAAATAIGAVGFFTVPAPAQAAPLVPLPLAPACNSYGFNGATALSQDNGWAVQFNSAGPSATGPATASSDTGTQMHGTVSGGINGRSVDLTINWDNGQKGRYVGQVIDEPGKAAIGTTGDAGWSLLGPLQCLTPNNPLPPPPPPSAPAQPPTPAQPPAPAAQKVVTVTSDVDVYDVPGGDGNIIGVLRQGQPVTLVGSCSQKDWCHVATVPTQPGTPGNDIGWVWGNLQL